ncbi:MAG: U32 family peptidase [Candidatus Bathyarchaeota archaeon]|nr:MAG: U32 family peptidase [Candidatus Bathyarchaeota archaeon]
MTVGIIKGPRGENMPTTPTHLLSPISSYESATRVISAGADEVYCAVRIPGIKHLMLNRPPVCAVRAYDELKKIVDYAHDHNVKVNVTTELPFMAEIVEEKICNHVLSCVEQDIDALIVGDIGILLAVKNMDPNIPLYASTFMASMNYEAVDFLRKLGVERIILERAVTTSEIQEIVRRSRGVEIEIFVHGAGCSNIEGNCYLLHSLTATPYRAMKQEYYKASLCLIPFKIHEINGDNVRTPDEVFDIPKEVLHQFANQVPILDAYSQCSLCRLPELIRAGVTGFKIVGRCLTPSYQERTTRWYRELIDLIEQDSMEAFQERLEAIKREPIYHLMLGRERKNVVIPVTLMKSSCQQKRCFYSPLFFAPYKQPPWSPNRDAETED